MKSNHYVLMLIFSMSFFSCKKDTTISNEKPVDNYETLKSKVNASYNVDILIGSLLKDKNELFYSLRKKEINFEQFNAKHKKFVEKLIAIDKDILKLKKEDIRAILDKIVLGTKIKKNSMIFLDSQSNADLWQDCIDVCYIILGNKLDAIEIDLITVESDYNAEFNLYYQQCIAQYSNPNYSQESGCQNYAAGVAFAHLQAAYQRISDDQDQAMDEWVNCESACDVEYPW